MLKMDSTDANFRPVVCLAILESGILLLLVGSLSSMRNIVSAPTMQCIAMLIRLNNTVFTKPSR